MFGLIGFLFYLLICIILIIIIITVVVGFTLTGIVESLKYIETLKKEKNND